MGESPQHGESLPDRVRARRQPLVRQGFPAGEARHAVRREERAEPGRQVLGLPGRGRDREHEAGGAVRGQHGRQHRPQRRRRDQVFPGERRGAQDSARLEFRTRDHVM